jgi:hypothetical protein
VLERHRSISTRDGAEELVCLEMSFCVGLASGNDHSSAGAAATEAVEYAFVHERRNADFCCETIDFARPTPFRIKFRELTCN